MSRDRRLLRFLHGELRPDEARALQEDLERDSALRQRLAALESLWQGLEPPPPTPAPYGFAARLERRLAERRMTLQTGAFAWAATPPWGRAMAGAALVAGMAMGLVLGRTPPPLVTPVAATAPMPGATPEAPVLSEREPPRAAARAEPPPPSSAGATSPAPGVPGSAALLASGEPGGPLTGEPTMAEEYWEALAGAPERDIEGSG